MNDSEPKKLIFDLSHLTFDDERAAEYDRQLEETERENKRRRYKSESGVPRKFYDESIETYIATTDEEKTNKMAVEGFIKNPSNKILILCGKNGNGKSHLGCSAIRELGGHYITASELCIEYDACGSYQSKMSRTQLLRMVANYDLFVIDECGKYTLNKDLEMFLLAYIVSTRYENNLPTILITNANKREFIEFLGKSVFDRLTEVCITLEFNGISKRKQFREV